MSWVVKVAERVRDSRASCIFVRPSILRFAANTLPRNIGQALNNFTNDEAPAEAGLQASNGQAQVIINATGSPYWNDPGTVLAFFQRIANNPRYAGMSQLTVITSDGPLVWTRP